MKCWRSSIISNNVSFLQFSWCVLSGEAYVHTSVTSTANKRQLCNTQLQDNITMTPAFFHPKGTVERCSLPFALLWIQTSLYLSRLNVSLMWCSQCTSTLFSPNTSEQNCHDEKKKAKHLFRLLQIFCFYFRRSCRSFYQSLLFVLFINSLCLHFQGMYDWLFFSLHVCKREEFTGLKTMPTLCHLVQEGERTN